MTISVDALIEQAREQFSQAGDAASLENAKARFLGKQGSLTELLKSMASLSPDEKRTQGARINLAKQEIESLLNLRRAALNQAELDARLASEQIDVTLPGRGRLRGRGSILSSKHGNESKRSFGLLALMWQMVQRLKTTGPTSLRSTTQRIILRVPCKTPFMST